MIIFKRHQVVSCSFDCIFHCLGSVLELYGNGNLSMWNLKKDNQFAFSSVCEELESVAITLQKKIDNSQSLFDILKLK